MSRIEKPTFTIYKQGKDCHCCEVPGLWERHKLGLKEGAEIRCNECGTMRRLVFSFMKCRLVWEILPWKGKV